MGTCQLRNPLDRRERWMEVERPGSVRLPSSLKSTHKRGKGKETITTKMDSWERWLLPEAHEAARLK